MKPLPRRRLLALAVAAGLGTVARAETLPAELSGALGGARLQGSGRMTVWGLSIYDAWLWVGPQPVGRDWADVPFALELEYRRPFKGADIARRSLEEMRRLADIRPPDAERWLGAMQQLFPDVDKGDRITGLNAPGRGARYYLNGTLRGELPDPQFARLFFGIWLSPRTVEPGLRDALLGRRAS